jgi:K+-sensing histidine kinase KdpD
VEPQDRTTALFSSALGALAAIGVAMALVGVRDSIANADVALLLMLVVVLAAVGGGRLAGSVTAIAAALAFDFFHTQPYNRLTIDTREDVVTTALLLVVGLLVGHIAARGRVAHSSAARSHGEVRRIYRVAELAARGDDPSDVILGAQAELTELLQLAHCWFEAAPFPPAPLDAPPLARMERTGAFDARTRRWSAGGFELPEQGVELQVLGRGQLLGRFVLEPTPHTGVSLEQRVVAVAIADQVGSVLAAPQPGDQRGEQHA